jgi:hypothetical protein
MENGRAAPPFSLSITNGQGYATTHCGTREHYSLSTLLELPQYVEQANRNAIHEEWSL